MSNYLSTDKLTVKLDVIPSKSDDRDFEMIKQTVKKLPKKYMTADEDIFPVKNQGVEGSCSAQTAATIKEAQERTEDRLIEFSPHYIYAQREDRSSEGMTPRDTMKLLTRGILPQTYWRGNYQRRIPFAVKQVAHQFRISGYARVGSVRTMKEAILNNGGVYIAAPVYNDTERVWKKRDGDQLRGGHAMAVIGWDDDKKGFVVKNSWGSSWGDRGYTILPYTDLHYLWEAWTVIDDDTMNIFNKRGKLLPYYHKKFKELLKMSWIK